MKKVVTLIIASALILTSCSSTSSATNLDSAEFAGKIVETDVVTLDVRTAGEFMAGHINGAINIDVEGNTFDAEIANLDKSKTYSVYCQSGRRSLIAVDKMATAGFASLFNLENGIANWSTNGWPVVTS
jgi:rhodanese-related sulfurtransferase|uniref:rhodanese-like domain-containing protein n=1 Tax=Candidatus Planktophila sp. TaxID=2175601 RepID=UPI00404996BA